MTSGGSVAEEHTIQWCGTVGCIRVSMLQPADSSQQQLCVAFAERKPHGNASSCEELPAESRRRVPQFWITGRMRDVRLCGGRKLQKFKKVKIPDYSLS